MIEQANQLSGEYLDGVHPVSHPASLTFSDTEAFLVTGDLSERCARNALSVSPRIGTARRFIALPGGAQFVCADHSFLDRLPQEGKSEGLVAWLEARLSVAIFGIVLAISIVLGAYFFVLPAAAKWVVTRIPMETEQILGAQMVDWLDDSFWFNATELSTETQDRIRRDFDQLKQGLNYESYLRLDFRASGFLGANAFALPGGTIVITDAMVELAETDEEIAAILAHELGHIEHRHTLRHLIQNSITAVLVTTITADAASLSVAVVGLPALVAQAKYSRDFETESDDFAFDLLRKTGRSPEAFASLMERFSSGQSEAYEFSFLSSHPGTAERVARAREAARKSPP